MLAYGMSMVLLGCSLVTKSWRGTPHLLPPLFPDILHIIIINYWCDLKSNPKRLKLLCLICRLYCLDEILSTFHNNFHECLRTKAKRTNVPLQFSILYSEMKLYPPQAAFVV
jgi:hypothetical protein